MYKDAKKALAVRRYSSISELIRDSLRRTLYPKLTVNGFTEEFEDQILASEAEPEENDSVWETEGDITRYFRDFDKRAKLIKNDQNKKIRPVRQRTRPTLS